MKMQYADEFTDVEDVPATALLAEERFNRYGSVDGLDDDELASPDELERLVFRQEWGPILKLPVRHHGRWQHRSVDEDGRIDFGAFATVDFERQSGGFDKLLYKADKLREELRDVLIMMSTISRRLPKQKARVLKLVRMNVIDLDHLATEDMHALAKYHLRARRIRAEIGRLTDASLARRKQQLAEVMT